MIQEQITTLTLPYPLGDKRVRVYVPAHEEGETFPVVYMTDGQNLFEDTDLRFGCWYTREAVAEERSRSGQAAIIVGIHNDESPRQRANELTPKSIGTVMLPPDMPEEERVHVNPSGEVFDDFVVNTVMPAVEAQFPVRKGRNETAFCGSSSGGLQSYFTALSHPDKFCAAGVFSPALMFYSPEDMRSWIASVMRDNMPYLYFYMGGGDELEQIRKEILPTDIQVALTHTPLTREYVADLVSWGGKEDTFSMRYASLILAGHYNGGQWRLPFVGAVHVPELGWFPEDSLVQGLSYLEGIPQYVSPGLGSDPHYEYQPGRVFNPPVMTRIVLTRRAK